MNPSVYRDRHAEKVVSGTRETLPRTAKAVSCDPISAKREVVNCVEGVGGGHSTEEARTTQPRGGKGVRRHNTPLRSWASMEV